MRQPAVRTFCAALFLAGGTGFAALPPRPDAGKLPLEIPSAVFGP